MKITPNQNIDVLAPYVLADLSVPEGKSLISLAQNELCFEPTPKVVNAVSQASYDLQLYPDPDWSELTESIAQVHDLEPKQILCGAGSMELLEVLGRVYLSTGNQVVMSEYGYSFFKTVAQMYGAAVDIAEEINFKVDIDKLLQRVNSNTKIVFIANPANPTGTLISANEIRRLREGLKNNILLILDEAYAEFTDEKDHPPLFDLVDLGNTVVLRTFSKIYGLAGLRVGWGYFPPDIYVGMRKVLNPNNISAPSQAGATTAMQQQDVVKQRKNTIDVIRTNFCTNLKALGLQVPQSYSNFVLINFKDELKAQTCFKALRAQGIMMRPMGAYGLTHCLRATLSTLEHMNLTIQHLTGILEELES